MQNDINILGYSGSNMSLILETLHRLNFKGKVNIIMHDDIKYFDVPFSTDLNFKVVKYNDLSEIPYSGLFFCSNKPSNKKFLYSFFSDKWSINEDGFTSIIHPSSVIASSVKYKGGVYIEPLSVISPYTEIGFGVSVNRHCSVGHHNILHDYCSIYPGTHLTGNVEIGRAATIGPGTTIFSGVKIGENTVIGGGSVVTRNIPHGVLAYGNPCKPVSDLPPEKKQNSIT